MQSTETSKIGQWKSQTRSTNLIDNKEEVFKEILIGNVDLKKHQTKYRRYVYLKGECPSSHNTSCTSSSSSDDEMDTQEDIATGAPHRIPLQQRNVQRIKRTVSQKFIMHIRGWISIILSAPVLAVLVTIAAFKTGKSYILDAYYYKKVRPQDYLEALVPDEVLTRDETYYAGRWGYVSEKHEVLTDDGYILIMYRIYKRGTNPQGKRPVLIGHGLFQCSGAFVLNEEQSLAFMLIEQGYDVWTGNNRSIAGLEHVSLSHEDPEYWNWGLKELGVYDLPAMIDHVRLYSGSSKVAYVGHSQGNAQAFIGLSLLPELGDKLSCFVALAPAVFSGNLVNTFPLALLINMGDWLYSLMFGSNAFLPIMSLAQSLFEPKLFCFLAYSMFSYLFTWWDSHWLRRRKAKYFQYTPRLVSSKLISDWIAGWGRKGVCLYVADNNNYQRKINNKVPLVVFYGTADFLVNGERFVRTFPGYEKHGLSASKLAMEEASDHDDNWNTTTTNTLFPMLDLVHVERLEGYEHMDTIWGHDNHKTTYPVLLSNLKNAKWD